MNAEISLKDRIVRFLRNKHTDDPLTFINGGEIEREALIAGYKASNASRRLRELVNKGVLEKNIKNGCVEYRYVGTIVKAEESFNPEITTMLG